ncbi:hypothetical protein [Halalkalibacterium halodurans]|jgi:fluoroquinolone transport system permease protein|uniref:Fluoroquinolone transport system permease protein n=1 Tax=Halalkalibacterium halodurans TaxID=86665 RepID=A0A0M0KLB2_ALKHA|nr:hypothetical protein [Halalkalibacterium halodurans]TPE69120.1 hypothetical protein AMD02_010300 [Halalkalibacterium halodurans]
MRRVLTLALRDSKLLARDPLVALSIIAPLLLTIVTRLGLNPFIRWLDGQAWFTGQLDIVKGVIIGFSIGLIPFLIGALIGLMILDEQDEHVLQVLFTSPLKRSGYFFYRLTAPMIAGFGFVLFFVVFGANELLSPHTLLISLLVAGQIPLFTLALIAIARSKVQGLVIVKGVGLIQFSPVILLFSSDLASWLSSVFPAYWHTRYFLSNDLSHALYAFGCQSVFGMLLYILYARRVP